MKVKCATEELIPIWRQFRNALFGAVSEEITRFDIERILEDPDQQCILIFDDNDVAVGFAEMALRNLVDGCSTSPVAYLEGIYVDPAFRGRGYGAALLDDVKAWAIGKGCTELASDSTLEDESAQEFHRKMGFEEVDRIVQFRQAL